MAIQSLEIKQANNETQKNHVAGLMTRAKELFDKLNPQKKEKNEIRTEKPTDLAGIEQRVKEEEERNTAETEAKSLEMELKGVAESQERDINNEKQNAGYVSYFELSGKRDIAAEDADAQKIMKKGLHAGALNTKNEYSGSSAISIGRESVDVGHPLQSAADFIKGYDLMMDALAKEEATAPASVASDLKTFAQSDRIKDCMVAVKDEKGKYHNLKLGDIAKTSPETALKLFNNIHAGNKEVYGLEGKEPRSKEMIALSKSEARAGLEGFAKAAFKTGDVSTALEAYQRLGTLEEHAIELQQKIEELMDTAKTGTERLSLKGQLEDLLKATAK
ncbi:hypothetical protein HY620_01005 [Candidatus Uhrbacteria bacterium]|nr:hypothetical protein [Candidatus Uhrbacteria bacterium]